MKRAEVDKEILNRLLALHEAPQEPVIITIAEKLRREYLAAKFFCERHAIKGGKSHDAN